MRRTYTIVALSLLSAATAKAAEPAPSQPVQVSATQTAVVAYHANNRDAFVDNDDYAEWINRLSLQLSWQKLSAGLRLDSAAYFAPPNADYLASNAIASDGQAQSCDLVGGETLGHCYDRKVTEYQRSLLNRYQNSVYPSKLYVTYGSPELEITLGDFYAQFGRGLALSVRKIDEFAYDTTIRGAKLDVSSSRDGGRIGATLLAGYANPLRVDEISGRTLTAPRSWFFAGMPTVDRESTYGPATTETFRPDGIVGLRFEGGSESVLLGAYGSLVARGGLDEIGTNNDVAQVAFSDSHPARQAKFLETFSTSISLPRLTEAGALYVEVAGQRRDPAKSPLATPDVPSANLNGQAVYASLSLGKDAATGLVELRHTRRFSPLMANVDVGRASEFFALQYSAPPTTEPITTDTEFNLFGYCTTGGRARVDYRASDNITLYGSLGWYATWSERFGDCGASGGALRDEDQNQVWDPFEGIVVTYDHRRSRANVWGGLRFDDMAVATNVPGFGATREFYRERYIRYDALHTIDSTWAVQVQGTHRARSEPETDRAAWSEGENYTAVHWSSKIIASFGYEYTTRYGNHLDYFNGSILYRLPHQWLSQDSSVRIFVGQQRGALRCVNGVCKLFPDFTGARAEIVLRF